MVGGRMGEKGGWKVVERRLREGKGGGEGGGGRVGKKEEGRMGRGKEEMVWVAWGGGDWRKDGRIGNMRSIKESHYKEGLMLNQCMIKHKTKS
jgi:hypothetical protein